MINLNDIPKNICVYRNYSKKLFNCIWFLYPKESYSEILKKSIDIKVVEEMVWILRQLESIQQSANRYLRTCEKDDMQHFQCCVELSEKYYNLYNKWNAPLSPKYKWVITDDYEDTVVTLEKISVEE